MNTINVKCLSETEISIAEVFQLVHDSFQQWIENGLESAVAKYSLDDYTKKTSNATIIVAISEKGELLGTHTLVFDKTKCCFGKYLAVSPNAKRLGIGKLLLDKEIEIAKNNGCEYLLGDTAEKAYWSVHWHLKNGYKKIGLKSFSTNNFYSIIFRKQLTPYSKWNSNLYCKLRFFISCIFTKLVKLPSGDYSRIGMLICKLLIKTRNPNDTEK